MTISGRKRPVGLRTLKDLRNKAQIHSRRFFSALLFAKLSLEPVTLVTFYDDKTFAFLLYYLLVLVATAFSRSHLSFIDDAMLS